MRRRRRLNSQCRRTTQIPTTKKTRRKMTKKLESLLKAISKKNKNHPRRRLRSKKSRPLRLRRKTKPFLTNCEQVSALLAYSSIFRIKS